MKFYRPKSILKLVLIGFCVVAFPLIFALVNALIYVDRLVDQSQRAVFQAVQATKSSLMLMEQINAMERSARQYQVLGDQALFEVYEKTHQGFQDAIVQLSRLPLDEVQRGILHELVRRERELFNALRDHPFNSKASEAAISEFSALSGLAQSSLTQNSRLIDREIDVMQRMAADSQKILVWQAIALVPMVTIFVIVFTILIARPIRQIDHAIRRLGGGEFASEIKVTGPQDLEFLGKRLDWLRFRLIELEEQKNKFLRHVSHELKTPLTAIREGAELLVDEVVGKLNNEQRKIARILRKNCLQLQKLIENLLNFSVVLLRHSALYPKPVTLNFLIEKVAADHQLALMAKSINLDLDLTDMTIWGDEEKLTVIVDNLLSNAVKFTPYGGEIRIRLRQEGDQAVLDVIDSGPGIAVEDKEKIFEAFYQGKTPPQGHVKGTGIGLSVAKEYVLPHRGTIEVINGRQNGAHFRVTLPINPEEDAL